MSAFHPVTPLSGVANDLIRSHSSSTLSSTGGLAKEPPKPQDDLLQPRTPFPHPYTPYSIQSQLMSRIYTTLKRKQIGIYESPTGTGKTLSLICSSLQWLREYQEYGSDNDETEDKPGVLSSSPSDEPDWCANYDKENKYREKQLLLQRQKQYRTTLMDRLHKLRIEEEENEEKQRKEKELLLQQHDDNCSQHSEDTGNDDLTDDSGDYDPSSSFRTAKWGDPTVASTRETALRKAKRLALKKRKRRAFQDTFRSFTHDGSLPKDKHRTSHHNSTTDTHNKNKNHPNDDDEDNEWLVNEYHSSSSSENDSLCESGNESSHSTKPSSRSHRKSHHSSSVPPVTSIDPSTSEAAQHTIHIADQIRAQLLNDASSSSSKNKHHHNHSSLSLSSTPANKYTKSVFSSGTNHPTNGTTSNDPYLDALQKEEENSFRPKILFVSRTHSQIAQFVREISKTTFGKDARVVVLGSRRNLCINPDVVSLSSDSRINERCLELQDQARSSSGKESTSKDTTNGNKKPYQQSHSSTAPPSSSPPTNPFRIQRVDGRGKLIDIDEDDHERTKPTTAGCPYLDPQEQSTYSDRLLARLRDVEDAAEIGWDMGTCAYYGSRAAVKHAEIVAMPYSMLLHAGTRQSTGISIDGNVIIIDEAHNIIDAINNTHASIVTYTQLTIACNVVRAYIAKYSTRMKGSNLQYCTDLANTFEGLGNFLKSPYNVKPLQSASVTSMNHPPPHPSSNTLSSSPHAPPGSSPAGTVPVSLMVHDKLNATTVPLPIVGNTGNGIHVGVTTVNTTIATHQAPLPVLSRSTSPLTTSSFWGSAGTKKIMNTSTTNSTTVSNPATVGDSSASSTSNHHHSGSTHNTLSNHLINELTLAPVHTSSVSVSVASLSSTVTIHGSNVDPFVRSRTSSISSELYGPSSIITSSALSTVIPYRSTTPTLTNGPSSSLPSITTPNSTIHNHPAQLPNPSPSSTSINVPNGLHTVSDFLSTAGLLNINLFHLRRYVETVDLLRKLRGFAEAGARAAIVAMGGSSSNTVDNTAPWMNIVPGEVMIHNSNGNHSTSNTKTKMNVSGTTNGTTVMNSTYPVSPLSSSSSSSSSTPSYMIAVAALQASYAFLISLMNADGDGRIIVNRTNTSTTNTNTNNSSSSTVHPAHDGSNANTSSSAFEPSYKFILLNPAVPFEDIVTRARSVILVGGTMQPMNDIVQQLFGHLPKHKVNTFSCGHIIPKENLAAFTVAKGPTGVTLDFRHALRSSSVTMDELGRCLVNIASVVPGGMVVFLPSFDYLRTLLSYWNKDHGNHNGTNTNTSSKNSNPDHGYNDTPGIPTAYMIQHNPNSLLAQLSKRKYLFAEPRTANQVDAILRAYTHVIQQGMSKGSFRSTNSLPQMTPPSKKSTVVSNISPADSSLMMMVETTNDDDSRSSLSSVTSRTSLPSVRYDNQHHASLATSTSSSTSMIRFPSSNGSSTLIPPSSSSSSSTSSSTTVVSPLSSPHGALLFCIVGGKMSEGINFSDDLARCVIVVGLPYPNPSDPELVERMHYLDHRSTTTTITTPTSTPTTTNAGREYYENITMRAVNQAIGRSIRHANDYATIVLLDTRYTNVRVRSKLPGWINESIHGSSTHDSSSNGGGNSSNSNTTGNWGTVASGLGTFFRRKREDK